MIKQPGGLLRGPVKYSTNMKQFPLEPVSVLGTPKLEEDATPIELSEASLSALFILGSNLIETMSSLDLIGSLITNKLYGSSLVEWLQKKMPRDMEVKGKYLHWNSLESYGKKKNPSNYYHNS